MGQQRERRGGLTEFVRIGLKRYMTSRYADDTPIAALVIDGAAEEDVRRALTDTPAPC